MKRIMIPIVLVTFWLLLSISMPPFIRADTQDNVLDGTPSQIGEKFGATYAQQIKDSLASHKQMAVEQNISMADLISDAKRTEDAINEVAPGFLEELKAEARAAGVDYYELLAITLNGEEITGERYGCTAIALTTNVTATGVNMLLKTRDGYYQWKESFPPQVIIVKHIANKHKYIAQATFPEVGFGERMNDAGVCVINTDVFSTLDDITYLSEMVYAYVLMTEADSASEAVQIFVHMTHQYGHRHSSTYMIADAKEVYVAEAGGKIAVVEKVSTFAVRTNFYCLAPLTEYDLFERYPACGKQRFETATSIIDQYYGNVTLPTLMNVSRNHQNGPSDNSICRHGSGEFRDIMTLASGILMPNAEYPAYLSEMWIALGQPCLSPYTCFFMGITSVPTDFANGDANALFNSLKKDYKEKPATKAAKEMEPVLAAIESDEFTQVQQIKETALSYLDAAKYKEAQSYLTSANAELALGVKETYASSIASN